MSYSVTGVQPIPAVFPLTSYDHAVPQATDAAQSHGTGTQGASTGLYGSDKSTSVIASGAASGKQASQLSPAKEVVPPRQADTVKLSIANAVRSLRSEGETDVQIAATLNLSTKEVDQHLYVATNWPELLTTAAQAASPTAASVPQPLAQVPSPVKA